MTLLGGRVRTGCILEHAITSAIVACVFACTVVIWLRGPGYGFLLYFMDWAELYKRSIIDAAEWRAHR